MEESHYYAAPTYSRCYYSLCSYSLCACYLPYHYLLCKASVPFSLCDLEGFPTDQPATAEPRKNVTSLLQRLGAPASPLRNATPAVTFISGALYFVEVPPPALPASPEHTPTPTPATPNPNPNQVAPPALGSWSLTVFLGAEQLGPTVNVTAFCPVGQLPMPMPDGDRCGCAPGTILKPGAAALLAAGVWEADENLCEPCTGVLWSEIGAGSMSEP